ncbi:MAG: UDP-galactopyranose mutase [Myxococcales bacterium]|jgi:UDP-galactopyranose mutase
MSHRYDVLVVGSGFAGAIPAERFASQRGKRVLLVERRKHLAGNMFDRYDEAGVLVHVYGPHIFRTDDERVLAYLSQFTEWNGYRAHRVLASVDGQLVPVPFNLTSLERLFPAAKAAALKQKLVETYGMEAKVPVAELRASPDPDLAALGDYIFEKVYLHYTVKQWGEPPDKLDFATITRRVPVRVSYDDRYFQQRHQGLPKEGYTRMFERMLAHPNIELRLGVDARELVRPEPGSSRVLVEGRPFEGLVIYSGAADELFDFRFGQLPYRSLGFKLVTYEEDLHQPVAVVNHPNEHEYTRTTEYKHMTLQRLPGLTTVAEEYPLPFDRDAAAGNEPYYPVPKPETDALYARYREEAKSYPNLYLVGRLAEYRYYDMNDIIVRALDAFDELAAR